MKQIALRVMVNSSHQGLTPSSILIDGDTTLADLEIAVRSALAKQTVMTGHETIYQIAYNTKDNS